MFISIIMPVYNAAETLARSINSIIDQTDPDWELICVDDGSKDNSYEKLLRYAEKDNRIKAFHKDNSGPGLTRNYAIERASGEYIGFLDADDRWNVNCISELKNNIKNNNSDVIFLGTRFSTEDKEWDAYRVSDFSGLNKKDIISCMMSGILPWGQEKVIRASIIKENRLVYSEDPIGEEAIFSFDALFKSKHISFIDAPMYYYYANDNSQHKLGNVDPWNTIVKKLKVHLVEIDQYKRFETSLNSLAVRAMIISVYRNFISQDSYKSGLLAVKNVVRDYSQKYELSNNNKVSLDRNSKVLFSLIKLKLYPVIFLLAQYRNRR